MSVRSMFSQQFGFLRTQTQAKCIASEQTADHLPLNASGGHRGTANEFPLSAQWAGSQINSFRLGSP